MQIFYLARINIATEDASTRHVFEFCRQFARLGHQVTLFVPDLGKRGELEGVQFVHVPVILKNSGVTFFSFYLSLFFVLSWHCLQSQPDILYTRLQSMEWMATILKSIFRFKYVVEVNGLAPVEMKINAVSKGWIVFISLMERIIYKLSDQVVVPSVLIRDYLFKNYGLNKDSVLVVSNGANPEFSRPMDKTECRKQLKLPLNGNYLVFVGSLKQWHGIDRLIPLMPTLVEKIPNLHLLIVGDGEKKNDMKRRIDEICMSRNIILAGRIPFEQVHVYINAGDICLAPYFEEGLNETGISPLKIFEYMACGRPIISNPVGGLDTLFSQHKIGVMVNSMDPLDWEKPIIELLGDPEKMKTLGDNGYRAVQTDYSWEAICKKIEIDLEQLVCSK
ncbi:MAG: glycosyltransferase family 4 protein [Nitrospinota bacterium]|nr:glycosyltransferase family 4 protein [Nitrospinota bacterium]